jgi:hypothetical protein
MLSPDMNDAARIACEHLHIVAEGDEEAIVRNVSADYFNHRSADEPPDTRQRGAEGIRATMRFLHRAFSDLRFEVHHIAQGGSIVALHVTLHGTQHGPFVVHDSPDARVTQVFPSNGRSFSARQTHWITVKQGAVTEHDAVRDDLGMAKQLGWLPPSLPYLIRMQIALRRERSTIRAAYTALQR